MKSKLYEDYIVFDLDETVVNLRDGVQKQYHKATGKDIHWSEWVHVELKRVYGVDFMDIKDHMIHGEVLENATLENFAVEIIKFFQGHGYKIGALTARAWHPDAVNVTIDYFKDKGVVFDKLHVIQPDQKKIDYLQHFGNVQLIVEDNPYHALDFYKNGYKTVLIDRPWNRDLKDLTRINSLEQLQELFFEGHISKFNHS